jgi:hypothetical protein
MNEYCGCKTLSELPHFALSQTGDQAEEFYNSFIATRTPVLITGKLPDPNWKVSKEAWTHEYLKSKSSDSMNVKVEYRHSTTETFGQGKEKYMTFHAFLEEVHNGQTNLYLSTQELEYDYEDHPEIISPPLTALTTDFPLRPNLFCSLVPANLNLWYGQTASWTSSGLHHDYHDNLYIILKGTKEITLCSPYYTENLYPVGKLKRIYPNGRINYEGQETYADGRSFEADRAWQASQRLKEAAMVTLQNSHHSQTKSSSTTAAESDRGNEDDEDEIDRALEDILEAECDDVDDDNDEDNDEEDDAEEDDVDDDEEDNDEEEVVGDEDIEEEDLHHRKRKATSEVSISLQNHHKSKKTKSKPDNFSQIDTQRPLKELDTVYPLYKEARKHSIKITLNEGDMLYIPAGWFHEVRSQGATGHMAFNYWFHPPNTMDFTKPYSSEFWPSVFASKYSI